MQQLLQRFTGVSIDSHDDLCTLCRSLFTGRRVDKPLGVVPGTPVLGQTFRQLEESVRSDCKFCGLRWSQLSGEQRDELQDCRKITFGFWQSRVGDGVAFEYWSDHKFGGSKPWLVKSVLIKAKAGIHFERPWLNICSEVPTNHRDDIAAGTSTGSPAGLDIARRWLKLCDTSHSNCKQWLSRSGNFLPSRLLDVGLHDGYAPRICEGTSLGPGTLYVTISHCWGGNVPMQLKTYNLATFQARLPDGIPTTVADAIKVARAIGIRYIWIDSLCIIQDSDEDWQKEARMMEHVYEQAWCNIAATKATDSSEGLFSQRDPASVRPVEIEARWRDRARAKYYCWIPDLLTENITDSLLLHRGWVTQERILSPRVIHFAKGQIFWECCSLRACETFPLGVPNNTSFKPSLDTHALTTDLIPFRTPALQRYRLWQMYVQDYTTCDLSEPTKDKFLAISGLARKIGPPEDYVAGLWKPILCRQLRWQVGSSNNNCTKQEEWRAPSWSWASLNGPVYLETPAEPEIEANTRIVFDVLNVDVVPATPDPFGAVIYGALQLTASLLRTRVYKSNEHPVPVCVRLGDIHSHLTLDVEFITDGETVFCMPLHINVRVQSPAVYGIVLEPAENPGEFYRRGVFYVSNVEPSQTWVERVGEAFRTSIESKEFGAFVGRRADNGWKQYQLTLF